MKKLWCSFVILLAISSCIFATWEKGYYVDDFGDSTGEEFCYYIAHGTFSNSATRNSSSPVRISLNSYGINQSQARIVFEPHDYDWNNPVNDYYDDSIATIKFKDEKGTVTKITSSNSEYGHNWNIITGIDAIKICDLFLNNKAVKCSIKIERNSYNFTIDCSDFKESFKSTFSSISNDLEFEKWSVSYSDSKYSSYKFSIAEYYTKSKYKDMNTIVDLTVMGYESDPTDYPALNLSFFFKDKNTGLYFSHSDVDNIEFVKTVFSVGKKQMVKEQIIPTPYLHFSIQEDKYGIYLNAKDFYSILKNGQIIVITCHTEDGEEISFSLSTKDLLKYTTYPY